MIGFHMGVFRRVVIGVALLGVGLVGTTGSMASATPSDSTPADLTVDRSAAIRYDTSSGSPQVFGEIEPTLWNSDDAAVNLDLPFPINFHGVPFTSACVTTNGMIFPANAGANCQFSQAQYDRNLGPMAVVPQKPLIGVVGIDLKGNGSLVLSDGRDAKDLNGTMSGTLASGVVTVASASHGLLAGDHVSFIGTGTILDSGGSYPVTVIDGDSFSIPLNGVSDLDTSTAGDQTSVSAGRWAYSNGVGTRGVYVGETTIDGRAAFVVTWYRVPHKDEDNPSDRSSTLQLVLQKGDTGDGANGWDFVVEYNIGSMTDDEDGYRVDNPEQTCTAWSTPWTSPPANPQHDQRNTCRWGMGFASYVGNIALDSIVISNGVATLTTRSPHGIDGTGVGTWLALPRDNKLGDLGGYDITFGQTVIPVPYSMWAEVVDATTFRIDTSSAANPALHTQLGGLATDLPIDNSLSTSMNASEVHELFADSSIADLIDTAGSTALINNSLNSNVLGRYRFGMVSGSVLGFTPPTMNGTPNVVSGFPIAPGAPTAVTASGDGGTAAVAWTAPTSTGTAAITRYVVTASPGNATCTATAPATTCSVTGLAVGSSYTFSVIAESSAGQSAPGVSTSFPMVATPTTTAPPTTMAAPTTAPPTTVAPTTVAPSTSVVPMRDQSGNLPQVVDATKALMVVNGVTTEIALEVVDQERLVLEGDGFEMALAGTDTSGRPARINDSGRLVVDDGGNIAVSGTGFKPGSVVDVWVMSDPVYLGEVTVGADGTFDAVLPLPADIVVGTHTVQANGVTADDTPRSLNIGIEVASVAVLPATGSSTDLGVMVAMVLAGLGMLGALISRRRTV